ncbi:monosaccharide ABC transporter ATP-binding protein, CUT2 family [Aeromonas sp. RU39B]|uniref:sugar ABC transporter ATP-binding protein n=1 Tax=Aeromonas sp. RU39B TaxID=1907416 RepID=UPI000953E3C1|nr:sugar ABC transporter ATP-binding protein [Aeromonas sp. RU39B]SIQ25313.1 monosaccharide ABC transporter ATP-binding protein, CUT2 family [Aeromonas sp. RU39B]
MEPFISLSQVSKTFHGTVALRDIELDFRPGEVHCLAGQNGCGKSTLIKIMSGVYQPDPRARIMLGGKIWPKLTPQASIAEGIQVIYQDLSLFPNLTVWENIVIHHYHSPGWVHPAALRERARQALASIQVDLPLDTLLGELSVARRQLVAISRALAQDARLIIMDEPTASLTHQEVQGLLGVVRQLRDKGLCVVFVSHRLEEVMAVSDRISVLKDGELVGTYPAVGMTARQLGVLMTGQAFDYRVHAPFDAAQAPKLEVRHLSRRAEYDDISFSLHAGEIVSLVGLLGAGRTELCLSLFGMTRPDHGDMLLDGEPLTLASNRDAIARGIAYVSEDRMSRGLVMSQSIGNNILSTVFEQVCSRLGLIHEPSAAALVEAQIRALAIKVADPALAVNTLSGGNAQRVSIAKWLATEPAVLILDSPTVGVDIANKAGIYHIIKLLAARGLAILLVCDELDEAWYQSHRVLVMQHGRLVGEYVPARDDEQQLAEVVNG